MAQWAVMISEERHEAERLFHHETLELPAAGGTDLPATGDEVLVVAGREHPAVVALGRVVPSGGDEHDPDDPEPSGDEPGHLVVRYLRRILDEPVPAAQLTLTTPVTRIDPDVYRKLADQVHPTADRTTWMVSLGVPIEAPTPAEAVRLFWSYVMELGPRELPVFVSPSGDELAMQAYVLGEETNLDPEEEDD
ncbi:hypothetical protein WEI85_08120 [Actinomycetes bacterium KLBMP 9797]